MSKILIVDEDQEIIQLIIKLIHNNIEEARVIGYVNTGQEAVIKAEETKPDIIIMELNLGGDNGFKVIEKIRSGLPQVHIVILTQYDYFELVKRAIELGVDDYIVKPISKSLFLDSINKVIIKRNKERASIEKESRSAELLRQGYEFARHSFIYSVLFNSKSKDSILEHKKFLELKDYGYIMCVEFVEQPSNYWYMESLNIQRVNQCIDKVLRDKVPGIVGPRIANRIIILISTENNEEYSFTQREKVMKLADAIIEKLNDQFAIGALIGIGSVQKLFDLHLSYEDALKSLQYDSNENSVVHIADVEENLLLKSIDYREIEEKLIESIKLGKDEALGYFFSMLDKIKEIRREDIKSKIMELLIVSSHAALTFGKQDELIAYMDYFEEIKNIEEEEIDSWATKKFHYIYKTIRTSKDSKISESVNNAIKYIGEHYREELFLEDVSRYVSITPQYFSKLFKEETGYNFVEWIAGIRIEKAKELMSSTNKKVKEICYLVGYNDPNYFSRAFKKTEGISPTEYMNGKA